MTRGERESYRRGYPEWATFVVIVAWLGLWSLWPKYLNFASKPVAIGKPRVSYVVLRGGSERDYMRPISSIGRPPGAGFTSSGGDRRLMMSGTANDRAVIPPKFLDWRMDRQTPGTTDLEAAIRGDALAQAKTFEPEWKRENAPVERSSSIVLKIGMDEPLTAGGLKLPEFSGEVLNQFDKPWQMVVYVQMGADGKPLYVLAEKGAEDQRITTAVIRQIYKGRLGVTGTACAGRIYLNYGLQ